MIYIFYLYGFILLQIEFYLNFLTQEAARGHMSSELVVHNMILVV